MLAERPGVHPLGERVFKRPGVTGAALSLGAGAAFCLSVSSERNLGLPVPTSYPCVSWAQHMMTYTITGRTGRASGSTYRTVGGPTRDASERAPLLQKIAAPLPVHRGLDSSGRQGARFYTLNPSFAAVVWPVAKRHRSTPSTRADATIAFLRARGPVCRLPRIVKRGRIAWHWGW